MILEARGISFRYGKDSRQILDDFSLKIESHERVGIVAPSGFGKTTFCKILAGYESPDRGRCSWMERDWRIIGGIVRYR